MVVYLVYSLLSFVCVAKSVGLYYEPLPRNYTTSISEYSELPNFAKGYSEFLLGAMIERISNSYDLFLTSFFLCHKLLDLKDSLFHPDAVNYWRSMRKFNVVTEYSRGGLRAAPPTILCRIRNYVGGQAYIVNAMLVGNSLSPDNNSNRLLDIFRCPMQGTYNAYMELAGSDKYVEVEILKGNMSIIKFLVPWKSRKVGFMLSDPPEASRFNPWKGFNRSHPGVWTHDKIHMSAAGWMDVPRKSTLPYLLEFIQHHLLLGFSHVYMSTKFHWKSPHMNKLLRVLKSFIDEGFLSVTSFAGDILDGVFSMGGMHWSTRDRLDIPKIIYVVMCIYYARGVTDYGK